MDDKKWLALIWCFLSASTNRDTVRFYMDAINNRLGEDYVMEVWRDVFAERDELFKVLGIKEYHYKPYGKRLVVDEYEPID